MSERLPNHRTMDDLARASGVSRPTLSKYFDDPEAVRPTTRARIEAALAGSDYRPNPHARNLAKGRTRTIGVIVPAIADPFYAGLVAALEERCLSAGYWPLVLSSHGSDELEARAFRTLLDQRVAGALAASLGGLSNVRLVEEVSSRIPIVFLDSPAGIDAPFVGNDNAQSVGAMVDYLCRSGEPPAYLDMPAVNANAVERRARYEQRMSELGHRPLVLPPVGNGWDFERLGRETMDEQLSSGRPVFSSLLCANDRLALGALSAAFARGVRVGREGELRIAGHDDHPLSRYACPALTTMAQDVGAMAERGTGMLLDAVRDGAGPNGTVRLEATLKLRKSA